MLNIASFSFDSAICSSQIYPSARERWAMSDEIKSSSSFCCVRYLIKPSFSIFRSLYVLCALFSRHESICVDWLQTKLDIPRRSAQWDEKTSYNFVMWKSFRFAGFYADVSLMHFLAHSHSLATHPNALFLSHVHVVRFQIEYLVLWGNYEMKQDTSAGAHLLEEIKLRKKQNNNKSRKEKFSIRCYVHLHCKVIRKFVAVAIVAVHCHRSVGWRRWTAHLALINLCVSHKIYFSRRGESAIWYCCLSIVVCFLHAPHASSPNRNAISITVQDEQASILDKHFVFGKLCKRIPCAFLFVSVQRSMWLCVRWTRALLCFCSPFFLL